MDIQEIRRYLLSLQQHIAAALERFDGRAFAVDAWQRPAGATLRGDGCVRMIEGGDFFERGGVNFSHVHGDQLPPSASMIRPELAGCSFAALGVSLVLHPRSPYCPTVHMNVRLLSVTDKNKAPVCWFGGGMDLTPYYPFAADCHHFHQACQRALDPFGTALYPRFKKGCDEYFYLKHRQEPRGIGGIFFDDVTELGFAGGFAMLQSVGNAFLDAYMPIIERRRSVSYGAREREFQAFRRGRYIEFNLAFDRGTLFGLQSGGRTEAILMSLPPSAQWRYDWKPATGSPEEKLYTDYLIAREWL